MNAPDEDVALVARAVEGSPRALAELAERFELVPRLLRGWNQHRREPLEEAQLQARSHGAIVTLWQRTARYDGRRPLNAWLALQAADLLSVDAPEALAGVLEDARNSPPFPGEQELLDELTRYRAQQAPGPTPEAVQRPIWAVIGVLGVIATFLAVSPSSPLRRPEADPGPASAGPGEEEPAAFVRLELGGPEELVPSLESFTWTSPPELPVTLIVEDLAGELLYERNGLVGGEHRPQADLPAGLLRWRLVPEADRELQRPTPWRVFDLEQAFEAQ